MHTSRKTALEVAQKTKFDLSDFNYDCVVQIQHGGLLFFHCVAVFLYGDYLLIVPEHSDASVHHVDELEYFAKYKSVEIKDIHT